MGEFWPVFLGVVAQAELEAAVVGVHLLLVGHEGGDCDPPSSLGLSSLGRGRSSEVADQFGGQRMLVQCAARDDHALQILLALGDEKHAVAGFDFQLLGRKNFGIAAPTGCLFVPRKAADLIIGGGDRFGLLDDIPAVVGNGEIVGGEGRVIDAGADLAGKVFEVVRGLAPFELQFADGGIDHQHQDQEDGQGGQLFTVQEQPPLDSGPLGRFGDRGHLGLGSFLDLFLFFLLAAEFKAQFHDARSSARWCCPALVPRWGGRVAVISRRAGRVTAAALTGLASFVFRNVWLAM